MFYNHDLKKNAYLPANQKRWSLHCVSHDSLTGRLAPQAGRLVVQRVGGEKRKSPAVEDNAKKKEKKKKQEKPNKPTEVRKY